MNSDRPQSRSEVDEGAKPARSQRPACADGQSLPHAGAQDFPRASAHRFALACALAAVCFAAACVVVPTDATNANANVAANANANANASPSASPSATPTESATPLPTADAAATPAPAPPRTAPAPTTTAADIPAALLIPVAGIRAEDLQDTFTQSRSEGRAHNAIDIIAPKGTPVLAATDGIIVKLFRSERGGITLYQRGADGKTIYYYAHLDRYADGLAENTLARRGDVLGYVGDTGNSTPGNYHLHFAVWITEDPKRYWDGANLNPYPLLTGK